MGAGYINVPLIRRVECRPVKPLRCTKNPAGSASTGPRLLLKWTSPFGIVRPRDRRRRRRRRMRMNMSPQVMSLIDKPEYGQS
jgi:hypothetical protein